MIELKNITISQFNSIIEARNKIFHLLINLHAPLNDATRIAGLSSELLRVLFQEKKQATLKLVFSKKRNYYSIHILIACSIEQYNVYKKHSAFQYPRLVELEPEQWFLEFKHQIMDQSFIPSEEYLHDERERLIQQSSGEMLQEIRQKNIELTHSLNALKKSSLMIQTEKMRALGSMTAGVAHELNNPMMGILNFIQYAIKHTEKEDRKFQPLLDAEREVMRCAAIISDLLTFSRMEGEGAEGYINTTLSKLFERTLLLQAYKLRSANIHVIKNFPENEPIIKLKENNIQQVVLNLMTNAIDAMNGCKVRELYLTIIAEEEYMEFKVLDTGMGITEEHMDRIFEPFFTTKAVGEGTGLGLSVSKSIVEDHGGSIVCVSEVGRGSCFKITLPYSHM